MERPVILIAGDAQARGVALLLSKTEPIVSRYEVCFADPMVEAVDKATSARCAFFVQQLGAKKLDSPRRLPRGCKHVIFPHLRLGLLWPLAVPNPHNAAAGTAGVSAFPWVDSFIMACVRRGLAPEQIMQYYRAGTWSDTWPDLNALFRSETATLLESDAKCDVKMGSYVLKHFRKQRLFWSINAPANALLAELTYRIVHACLGRNMPVDREALRATLQRIAPRDIMSHVSLPVHPLVASHFSLEWFDPMQRYDWGGHLRTFEEYFREMIAYAQQVQAAPPRVSN